MKMKLKNQKIKSHSKTKTTYQPTYEKVQEKECKSRNFEILHSMPTKTKVE